MEDPQTKLQSLSDQLASLQSELQSHVAALQTLQSQQSENTAVQREFSGASANTAGRGNGGGGTGKEVKKGTGTGTGTVTSAGAQVGHGQGKGQIYKLVGPVLLKQDRDEAQTAVDRRLEYIAKNIGEVEGKIAEVQKKIEQRRTELVVLQQQQQGGPQGKMKGQR